VQKHIQAAFLEFPNKSLKAFISRGTKGAIVLLQSPFLLSQHFHFFFITSRWELHESVCYSESDLWEVRERVCDHVWILFI